MLDELSTLFESLKPRGETHESVADIVQIRPETVSEAVEVVGMAIVSMLGGVKERTERVQAITTTTDTVLAPSVVLDENAQTVREMALGSLAEERPEVILAKNDAMAQQTPEEAERLRLIAETEAELARLYAASDEQFALVG